MKNLYTYILIIAIFSIGPANSQEGQNLPKGLTNAERQLIPNFTFRSAALTPPPSVPVRAAAEWEEVEYLLVTWDPGYQNILRQIIQAGVAECKVIITTQNETSVSSYLTANGASLDNVIFMDAPWNSIWIRDYAGNTVYSNDVGERAITDWIYNRPRPSDNIMPSAHAELTGIPIYITNSGTSDLVNTGGNYMSDGLGNAFASNLILTDNDEGNIYNVTPKTPEDIDLIMNNYMGISNYIKMPVLPFDGIHHIDMHMKLLDEETLLVSRYPPGVADGPQIEENINYILDNFQSPFGTPYKIVRIDSPPSTSGSYPDTNGYYRTFSNAVFVNKTIMIPLYRPDVDAAAIATYQQYLPGYTVVGIDVDNASENLIASSGAIHCITHTIGVSDPLLIVHQPVASALPSTSVPISASIRHNSGISTAKVFWRVEGTSEWTETVMTSAENNNFTAQIPAGTTGNIQYYIWAKATSGKELTRPLPAPLGFWTVQIQALSANEWANSHISGPYPNPASDQTSFTIGNIDGPVEVTVVNVLGQQLFKAPLSQINGTVTLQLDPSWQGTLFLILEGNFGKITRKLIKN